MTTQHVVFVVNDLSGLLHFRQAIVESLVCRGIRCSVVGPILDGVFAPLVDVLVVYERLGVDVIEWPVTRRGTNPVIELLTIFRLFKIYYAIRPSLVHHVTPKPVLYGGIAAKIAGVSAIVNAVSGLGHAHGQGGIRRKILRLILSPFLRLAHSGSRTRVIFQNNEDRKTLISCGAVSPTQARLIRGSGVDPQKWQPAASLPRAPIVTVASRMLKDKGIYDVIDAGRILRSQGVAIEIRLAGALDPGNPQAIQEEQIRAWEKEGIVKWLGPVSDMVSCWQATRIACLPTYYAEGMPKALIEAASCGLPIITTDTPGCNDICIDGLNGILVPSREPAVLANALKQLLENYEKSAELGKNGRERILNEFDLRYVVDRHLEIYREFINIP